MITTTVILATILLTLELLYPARVYVEKVKKFSYLTNGLLFIFNNVINFFLKISVVYLFISNHVYSYFVHFNPFTSVLIGILILDFSIYIWHRLNHKIPFLWNFHKCHHSETYLNTTSSIRFHIGELLLSVIFKSIILLITGIPFAIFIFYEALITIFALFHHANINLPEKAQFYVSKVLITPVIHRTHHSDNRKEYDTNFGVIFMWWDHIFRTLHLTNPKNIGISEGGEKNFITFLKFPFPNKQGKKKRIEKKKSRKTKRKK